MKDGYKGEQRGVSVTKFLSGLLVPSPSQIYMALQWIKKRMVIEGNDRGVSVTSPIKGLTVFISPPLLNPGDLINVLTACSPFL